MKQIRHRIAAALACAGFAMLGSGSTGAPATSAASGYHVADRIPLTDGWWDNATVEPVNNMFFLTRGNGITRIDLNTGLIDYRFITGLEGRVVVPSPDGKMKLYKHRRTKPMQGPTLAEAWVAELDAQHTGQKSRK